MRFSLPPVTGVVAALLTLGSLTLARPTAAQQPKGGQPAGAQPAAGQATAKLRDPTAIILDKLKRLDMRRDSARDTTAVRDSADSQFELVTPTPTPGRSAAAAGPPIQDDSITRALAMLTGFTETKYSGASARFAADTGRLVLTGPAQVIQGQQSMKADSSLVFNQKTQIACGYGKPVLSGAGQSNPVESDYVCYDTQRQMGVAFGAKTKFQEGSTTWYVDGTKTYVSGAGGEQKLFSSDAEFTDCDLTEPHYHFTASQVKIVHNDVLVARNVVLSFADVPVFWLPFMMQSMQQGRRSGILMPRFDLNDIARTNTNYQRRISNVGFYWAISDHLGALTSLDWFSNNYTAVNGAFDWAFRRQFLSGGMSIKRYWQHSGSRNFSLNANNSWRPDERTSVNLSASYASSSQFVLDQSFDPRELNRSIDSNLGLQRRFGWGSLDFAAQRHQFLQNDRVTMKLPSVSLSLTPITLFKSATDEGHWFNNIVWSGSGSYSVNSDCSKSALFGCSHTPGNYRLAPTPSTMGRQGAFSSSLSIGKFSWGQSINFDGTSQFERPEIRDTVNAPGADTANIKSAFIRAQSKDNISWSTSLGFQQRLIGTSSINPSLTLTGQSMRVDADTGVTGSSGQLKTDRFVAAPLRMNFGVGTQMDVYGFWPGIGPFSRIRHKLSPSFNYGYSPAPNGNITDLQRAVFGTTAGAIREVNGITIGLNQTFEAKYKESAKSDSTETTADTTEIDLEGEPRKPPQSRKMTLLALSTSALAYDFTRNDTTGLRRGITSTTISNDIRSDLIPGLQFSLTHEIFEYKKLGDPRTRRFSPFLTNASTSFSLNDNSWLFRLLGLAARGGRSQSDEQAQDTANAGQPSAADQANSGTGLSIVPHNRREAAPRTSGGVGSWNATFTYNLQRTREAAGSVCVPSPFNRCSALNSTQMIQSRFSFRPTRWWSVGWQTGFNVSERQFSDHVLTLSRDLHDWEANFDFVKAQNGNFTVQFRVNLKAQPDLKFDYHQQTGRGFPSGF